MFAGLGRLVYRRRLSCLALTLIFAVFAGMWGVGALGQLKNGGFEDPDAESTMVAKQGTAYFGGTPDIVVVYRSTAMKVDDQRFHGAVVTALGRLSKDQVAEITTFWSSHSPLLVSTDRHATYAILKLRGDDPAKQRAWETIQKQLPVPELATKAGGPVPMGKEFNTQVGADLARAEMLSFPVLLVLLLVVFGSLAAAVLPLVIGVFAILGALTLLRVLTMFTDVSVFSVNIITMLGLGLAIDYSLFVVRRFREELKRGASTETALANTMATAGRTVAFSGITVATSLAGLLLFPQMFLRSVGMGGIAVVVVAMVAALILLPTLLALLGHRIEAVRMPWRQTGRRARPRGTWHRLAQSVMRHPLPYFLIVTALLGVLVTPFLHVRFGNVDARVLPMSSESRQTVEALHRDFPQGVMEPVDVVLTGSLNNTTVGAYLEQLRRVPGVTGAEISAVGQGGHAAKISVRHGADAMSDQANSIVKRIRALPPPPGARSADVGGTTAAQMDLMASLARTLPWMALVVVAMTSVLLFAAFGSVVLPLKAVLMNVLSLGASFGAIVWAFQDGHLAGPLNFTSTGTVEATSMVLILAVVFGLSMDYEVFLLSRVREEWDRTHDNTAAVAAGMERTGGVITGAALLFLVVIGAFSMASISIVKLLGVGMFVAVVVDASLVRALLVPATMRALGAANWWLPRPLAWLHRHIDMRETDEAPPAEEPRRRFSSRELLDWDAPIPEPAGRETPIAETPMTEIPSSEILSSETLAQEDPSPEVAPGWEPLLPMSAAPPVPMMAAPVMPRDPPDPPTPIPETDVTTKQHIPHHEHDIVPNPEGPGWHWKTPEDDHARW